MAIIAQQNANQSVEGREMGGMNRSLGWLVLPIVWMAIAAKMAIADNLDYWDFDGQKNRLEIVTDSPVRPRAFMLANPTRIVIDLPGINFHDSTLRQAISRYIQPTFRS
jgi:hypothetical protein